MLTGLELRRIGKVRPRLGPFLKFAPLLLSCSGVHSDASGTTSERSEEERGASSELSPAQAPSETEGSPITGDTVSSQSQLQSQGQGASQHQSQSKSQCLSQNQSQSLSLGQGQSQNEMQTQGQGTVRGKGKGSWVRLFEMSLPQLHLTLAGTAAAVVSGSINPIWSLLIIDVVAAYYNPDASERARDVRKWAYVYLGLAGVSLLSYTALYFFFDWTGEHLVMRIRERMLAGTAPPLSQGLSCLSPSVVLHFALPVCPEQPCSTVSALAEAERKQTDVSGCTVSCFSCNPFLASSGTPE